MSPFSRKKVYGGEIVEQEEWAVRVRQSEEARQRRLEEVRDRLQFD
jgi:hypothetical protein